MDGHAAVPSVKGEAARFGTVVDYATPGASSRRVQGLVYTAVISGLLPLIVQASGANFTVAYQVLALMVGISSYFSLRHLSLTAVWDTGRRGSAGTELLLLWTKIAVIFLLLGIVTGYYRYYEPKIIVTWFVTAPLALVMLNNQLRKLIRSSELVAGDTRTAVLVFANDTARQFAQRLQASHSHELLGYFEDRDLERAGHVDGVAYLGTSRDIADYVKQHGVDVVFIILPIVGSERALAIAESLGDTTASVFFVPDYCAFRNLGARATEVNSMPALELMETPFYGADGLLKRAFDIAFSLFALAVLALPMAIIAALVKLTSPGPALFKQQRYGLNGKSFDVYKFRTMYVANRDQEIVQVSRTDTRVTPLGRILRRTSLDELPQFINVLLGDMSVVGPRPHTVVHNEHYRRQVRRYMSRHKVRPGITGLAQVRGLRGETTTLALMDARINCDIEYIRTWSVLLDLKIILRTILVVLNDKHAY
ncbi:MAG TPA: undecaprenyl-phosphate glucose phosphotransferase [Nevskiaceae bacterium]|nr:undecaprenyl-phosphate glucose phosphotransferase [Nevskiaceae bacterium]